MQKFKKALLFVLCVAMLTAIFAGCSKTESGSPASTATSSSAASTASSPTTPKEPVKFKAIGQLDPKMSLDNPVLKKFDEIANVKIEWEVVPTSSYNDRLTLIMASNELPDLMYLTTAKQYRELYQAKKILDIGDMLSKAPNISKFTDPASLKAVTAEDGKIYAMPRNSVPRVDGLAVRKDWLDKAGITLPTDGIVSIDQYTEILTSFTTKDPDGNNKNDTYGLTLRSTAGVLEPIERIVAAFDSSTQFEKAPAGSTYEYMNPMYSLTDPSFVKALEYMNKIWKAGYIDPNWPANDANTYMDRFQAGVAGTANCFGGWLGTWETTLKKNFPNAKLTYIYGIKNSKGAVTARSILGANVYGYWSIASTAAPKAQSIIGYLDGILSDKGWDILLNGIEGTDYTVSNGVKTFTDIYKTNYMPYKSSIASVRRYNNPGLWLEPTLAKETLDTMNTVITQSIKNVLPSLDLAFSPPSASAASFIDYQTVVKTTMSKIITGDMKSSEWTKMLEGWYKAGGETYVKEMNEYIKKINK